MTASNVRPWLLVIGGAERGGAEGQFVRLAKMMREAGKPVECVFLFGGGPLLEDLDAAGVPRHVLREGRQRSRALRALSILWAIAKLARLLRKRKPEVVMSWLTFATWPTLLLAEWLSSSSRIAGIRGEILESEVRWAGHLFRRALHNADAVVVNSPSLVEEAVSWGALIENVQVIPNGVELTDVVPVSDSSSAVVIANYRPYKGHADLLHALALCRGDGKVRLCGSGAGQAGVERLAIELGVRDRIHFVEQPADIRAELGAAGFAIHPSRTEGLSNAILEEMAAGLPVIAMDVGGNRTLVKPQENGFLLRVGDHASLANAIDDLSRDESLRRRLGLGSLNRVQQFGWGSCTTSYIELLERLARSRQIQGSA